MSSAAAFKEHSQTSDQVIRKLVHNLSSADSVDELKEKCVALTTHVNHEVSLTRDRWIKQLEFLSNEKEKALQLQRLSEAKIKSLSTELQHLQIEYRLVDKQRVKSLQSQLQAAIKEKETWQKRAEELEDYCETMQLVNSLHKSMSKDEELKTKYESQLSDMKSIIKDQAEQIIQLTASLQQVIKECDSVSDERHILAQQLHQERAKSIDLCQRLAIKNRQPTI